VGPRRCGVFRVEVREARIMHLVRRTLLGASAVGLATLLTSATLLSMAAPAGAATVSPQIPQFAAAQAAANWLVSQQAGNGSIGGSLSSTANAILALAAAHDTAAAQSALLVTSLLIAMALLPIARAAAFAASTLISTSATRAPSRA